MQFFQKTPKRLVMALMLTSTCMQAHAADWSSIIKKQDYEIFVDIDSYNLVDNYPSIVSKTVFNRLQNKTLGEKNIAFIFTQSLQQFNCKSATYRTKTIAFYDKKQKIIATQKGDNEFKAIAADSNEFSTGQLVCQVNQMVGGQ